MRDKIKGGIFFMICIIGIIVLISAPMLLKPLSVGKAEKASPESAPSGHATDEMISDMLNQKIRITDSLLVSSKALADSIDALNDQMERFMANSRDDTLIFGIYVPKQPVRDFSKICKAHHEKVMIKDLAAYFMYITGEMIETAPDHKGKKK